MYALLKINIILFLSNVTRLQNTVCSLHSLNSGELEHTTEISDLAQALTHIC